VDERKKLHVKRITEGRDQIAAFRQGSENAFSPTFLAWQQRIKQSLGELLGKDHDYTRRFSHLYFWETRVTPEEFRWSSRDQRVFEDDLSLAEQILSDAIEEFEISPPSSALEKVPASAVPQIVVNVNTVLSQTVEVEISQVLASLDGLALSAEEREQAETYAKELAREAKGQQRWSVLSKSLDSLKAIGKSVYERVAIPLILEMLKKQAGL